MLLRPFDHTGPFLRGNLHGHCDHSDGARSAADVVATYKRLGYDFTCLSDHLWSDTRFCGQTIFDSRHLSDNTFTTIISAELHCRGKKYEPLSLWHILANDLPLDFPMADAHETVTQLIDRARDAGAYVSIAHPDWYGMTTEEAAMTSSADAVEIYNHGCHVECDRGHGTTVTDFLLNEGHRIGIIATDDSHFHVDDFGGGWVMVAAERNTSQSLIAALKAGRHYSSTGAELRSLSLDGRMLTVECTPAISVIAQGYGKESAAQTGQNITRTTLDLGDFHGDYFRVTIIDQAGRKAWSNPYWFADCA